MKKMKYWGLLEAIIIPAMFLPVYASDKSIEASKENVEYVEIDSEDVEDEIRQTVSVKVSIPYQYSNSIPKYESNNVQTNDDTPILAMGGAFVGSIIGGIVLVKKKK